MTKRNFLPPVCLAALAIAFAQDNQAPPAIAQWGIANWASHMPPQLPSGAVAPGSLIRIRGWRLGPAPLAQVSIRIRRGGTAVFAEPLSAGENEIEARVPADAPLGNAMLQVAIHGRASLEWPVVIVPASFGAFSRNAAGWGEGEITNRDGAPNSATHPARPGETVTLAGTGLGANPARDAPRVLVAGAFATKIRELPRPRARPGVDEIAFTLPPNTPAGCHVPVEVISAPGIVSNTVTLAVNRNGGACADAADWSPAASPAPLRLGTLALLHADLNLTLSPTLTQQFPVDAGFASFVEIEPGASANPIFQFPPPGTCTTFNGAAGLHSIASPIAILQLLPGAPLDAGAAIAIDGAAASRSLRPGDAQRHNYWSVLGGRAPAPGARETPLYLAPGDYALKIPGSAALKPFQVKLRVPAPLDWLNRSEVAQVEPTHDVTVTWNASNPGASDVLIVAMNVDSRSGALGFSACLADAAAGRFQVPGYALANIPKTPEHPRGFPLNLMLLAEIPRNPAAPAPQGLDRILAFAASITGRSVTFK